MDLRSAHAKQGSAERSTGWHRRRWGRDPAVTQCRDFIGNLEDFFEAVRDVDDADSSVLQPGDDPEELFGFVLRKRRGRLILTQKPSRLPRSFLRSIRTRNLKAGSLASRIFSATVMCGTYISSWWIVAGLNPMLTRSKP